MAQKKPTIQIGKSGVTDSLIDEIKLQVRRQKTLKVRILKSARTTDREKIAQKVAEKTNSRLIEVRGNTFTLAKK